MDKKIIIAILLVLIVVSAGTWVVLFNNGDDGDVEEAARWVIDAEGRNVTLASAPVSIVSCAPSLTELVYSLGIDELLVGVTDFCDFPADVGARKGNGSLVSVGGYFTPSLEAIIETNATLVLIDQGVSAQMALVENLELVNMTVIVMYKGATIEEVYKNIGLLGKICWADTAANGLISNMRGTIQTVTDAVDGEEKPSVTFCCWLSPICVAGNDTYVNEMMVLTGGENTYGDLSGWPYDLAIDSLMERDPDFIIITGMMMLSSGEAVLQSIRNDTLWSSLRAVQNDHVYVFVNQAENVFNRPSARMAEGVQMMAMILHSDVFNVTVPNVFSNDYADWLANHEITDFPVDVQDSMGRTVEALGGTTTLVSLEPSITELVYSLELDANLVGVSSNCNFPGNVTERVSAGTLHTIGKYNKPNIESIANLTPGLVLLDGGVTGHVALIDQLDDLGIEYLVLYPSVSIASIYNNLELVGDLMGKQSAAQEKIGTMASTISEVTETVAGSDGDIDVMFSIYFSLDGTIWVAGNDTFTDNTISLAGGVNAFGAQAGYYTVSPDSILDANPDVLIITDSMAAINVTALWNYLESDPIWSNINAVKNGSVYVMTLEASNIFNRPSVRVADSVNLLAVTLFPELFGITSLPLVFDSDYAEYL